MRPLIERAGTGGADSPASWTRYLLPLVYLVAAAIVLGANPFRGQLITPVDILPSQRAWKFVDPGVEVRNYHRSDILNALIPTWTVAREQLRSGQVPLWNDKVAGGGSLVTVSSNLFTPAFLIFAAAPNPGLGFYLAVLFNLAVAGLGMHLFLRRHVGVFAAVVGALTFEFCGFNAAWLYWPHVLTLMWAPWLLWAVDRCLGGTGAWRGTGVALATALVAMGGFPFVSVLVLEAGALYALVLWVSRARGSDRWRFVAWYGCASALGLLLAAIPLFGLVHWLHQFDLGYRLGRGSYLDFHAWKQLLPPWAWDTRYVEQTMYVGLPVLVLALCGCVATVARWRKSTPLAWFALILAACTAGLVFGLWPMWLIGWLPGMAYNSWSRAIGMMDLALVLLGAVALDGLVRKVGAWRWSRWARFAVVVLAVIQVAEVAVVFRMWNGPVPARDFYPEVPSIDYMKRHAGPFDYVITDRSFLMSGTLGAYGLREWLAHYFRTPALQRVLHEMAAHPFNTHVASASRFKAGDIRYKSPAMAAYNVRFAAVDARYAPTDGKPLVPVQSRKRRTLPPMSRHVPTQWFTVRGSPLHLAGISIRLMTHRHAISSGTLAMTLRDASGAVVATSTIGADVAVDNTYLYFDLATPVVLEPGQYAFSLQYSSAPAGSRLAARVIMASTPGDRLEVDGDVVTGNMDYRLYPVSKGPYRRVFESAGTAVLENTRSPQGPYFLSSVKKLPDARSGRDVEVENYRPTHFTLRYSGHEPGFVIVPMSANPDWRVRIDGNPATYSLKGGVMPAVPVRGPAVIDFDYRPPVTRWWKWWLALALAGVGVMGWVDLRNGRHAGAAPPL